MITDQLVIIRTNYYNWYETTIFIITSFVITRFHTSILRKRPFHTIVLLSRHNTLAQLGTIDARWLAIVVLGGLRGPGTYGEKL